MQDGVWLEQPEPLEQITLKIGEPEKIDDDYIPNLFDLAGSTIPLTSEPVESTATVRPGLSQNVIDAALTLGANDPDSHLRIIAEFMKDKPLEENALFLQTHYKENGAGFYIGERKYSLWYDKAGMQIAPGESALTFTATALTWEQAAERIRALLDEGRYASQSMLYRAWPFEKNRVAEALEYLHRDIGDEYKDKYLPALTAALSGTFGYPDVVDKTKELLEQPEQLKSVIDEFAVFQKDYAHNRDILRFHFHRPDEIMQGLQDLQCTPLKFTGSPDYAPVERFYISQDEIDNLLREQPDQHDYRLGIYNFFEQHPDRKEREKYLSHLHGEYSGYHGGNDNITYTSKELTFTHGDITEPYAAVKMKWSQVRKRIEELIKKDAFLSPEDREIMESRTLEKPSEEIDPLETAKSLIRKFRQSDRDSLDFSDLSKVLLTNAITENEKHGIQVFADLDNFRLLFEVNGQTVSTLQFHDVNDLNEHLEKLSAAELIDFAKEQYIINLDSETPPKISEQDAKKHDILMANTRAHFASYEEVKQAHPGDIVLFQRGDFFEMYGPDARVASMELDIRLTNRNIPELGRVAMCGITAGSLDKSVEILRKKHGVTVSSLPEKGTERQTFSLPSFDSELDTVKKMIQDFCQLEYDSDADFSDLEHVSLAYTTTGNSEREIQVEVDLVHFVLTKYLDGQVCDEYHYNSLRELTEAELSGMNFDELVTLEANGAAEIAATPDSQSTQILDSTFNYRRLSQMKADCDYFLGAGNRAEKHLWHGNIHEHIGEMRRIYGLLPEKPEWLTMEEIDSYAQRMARRYQVVVYHTIVNGFDEMPEWLDDLPGRPSAQ
ncbi:LPD11 domain-containing protein [Acutalibacter muris]|uniref:LPD11 domain-containing protein n=2 Tax=Acutalibacter muris TaxID=1796620 RepID=UPI002ED4C96A